MDIKACLSHKTDEWKTPSVLYKGIMDKGFKDLFPFGCTYDQMEILYQFEKLYINPPFSKLDKVVDYVIKLVLAKNEVLLLMPARTDTKYFHKLCSECYPFMRIYFLKGRLHFNDSVLGAPFPTLMIHIKPQNVFRSWFYACDIKEFLRVL